MSYIPSLKLIAAVATAAAPQRAKPPPEVQAEIDNARTYFHIEDPVAFWLHSMTERNLSEDVLIWALPVSGLKELEGVSGAEKGLEAVFLIAQWEYVHLLESMKPMIVRWVAQANNRHHLTSALRVAIETDHIPVAVWFVSTLGSEVFQVNNALLLKEICARGDAASVVWFNSVFGLDIAQVRAGNNAVVRAALRSGSLATLQCLVVKFELTRDDVYGRVLNNLCSRDNMEMIQWIIVRFGITVDDIRVEYAPFKSACSFGNIPLVQWMVKYFGLTAEDIDPEVSNVMEYATEEVAAWLVENLGGLV